MISFLFIVKSSFGIEQYTAHGGPVKGLAVSTNNQLMASASFDYSVVVWDLNPIYRDDSNDKKVIRGGSWKDIAFFIEVATRTFEYKDSTRAFIGFRTAMPHLGRNLEGF